MSVHGGYLKGIAQTQGVKLVHVRVDCAGGVALVDGQGNGLARPLQNGRHSGVGGRQAHLDVGYHNDSVGQLDADLRLAAHKLEDLVVCPRLDAAGVHEVKGAAAPLAGPIDPVPGDPRRIFHNGSPPAGQFIEEHRLAHIGTADNGHQRFRHMHPSYTHIVS